MAEAEEKWADFNPLITGSAGVAPETPAPPRGWTGAIMDTGIDLAKSTIGIGKQIHGVREAVASAIDPRGGAATAARGDVDALSDLSTTLESLKTPRGRELTREPESFSDSPGKYAINTAVNMAPYIPLAIATGGWGGAAAFGGLGFGQVRTDLRENIRNAPLEELQKNPEYINFRDQGMTDEQAREELYLQASDPRKLQTYLDAAPNVAGQVATGGVGGAFIKGLTRGVTRRVTSDITQRVMDKANTNWMTRRATGAGIGAGAGAMAGAGQEASRQLSEQTAGIQTDPFDWGKTGAAAGEQAALFSTLGAVGYRGVPKPKVPPVGMHVEATAKNMATDMTDVGSGRMMPEGEKMTPATGGKPMELGDIGVSEYASTGDWRRPDSPRPPGAEPPPPSPAMPHVSEVMHPRDALTPEGMRRYEEEAGIERMQDEGYGPALSRKPLYGEAPPAPDARLPRPGGDRFKGQQAMRAGDLGEADPNFPHQEFGMETERQRPARGGRKMVPGEVGYHMEDAGPGRAPDVTPGREMKAGDIYRDSGAMPEGSAPVPYGETHAPRAGQGRSERPPIRRGGPEAGEELTGVPVEVEPPPAKAAELPPAPEKPKNISDAAVYIGTSADGRSLWMGKDGKRQFEDPISGAQHREPEANSGLPEFQAQHETPPEHHVSKETVDRDVGQLAALMNKQSANTRGQWADRLQRMLKASKSAGRYAPLTIRIFPEAGQRLFGALRGKMDALLHHDPQKVIDAIRGDVERVKGRPEIPDEQVPAVRELAQRAGDKAKEWGDAVAKIAGPDNHLVPWIRLPKELREFLQEPGNKDIAAEAKRAVHTNPLEFADMLRGEEHKPGPTEYAYKKDLPKARKEAAVERAETEAETAAREAEDAKAREEISTEGEAAVGMLEPAEPPPPAPPRAKYEPPKFGKTLTLEGAKPKAPGTFGEKLQRAIDVAKRRGGALIGNQAGVTAARAESQTRKAGAPVHIEAHTKPIVATVRTGTLEGLPSKLASHPERVKAGIEAQSKWNKDEFLRRRKALDERVAGHMEEREREAQQQRVENFRIARQYVGLIRKMTEKAEAGLTDQDRAALKGLRRRYEIERTKERSRPGHKDYDKHLDELAKIAKEEAEIRAKGAKGKTKADLRREADTARKAEDKAPEYEDRDQIAENHVKIDDPAKRKREVAHLDSLVTGLVKHGSDAETIIAQRELTENGVPPERLDNELLPRNYMTASAEELKAIGKALAERGKAILKKAEDAFMKRSLKQFSEHGRHWRIGLKVGKDRGPHGVYYNHLVGYRKFNASMERFSGSKELMHTFIINHYVAERLAMMGKHSRLEQFYREQYNFMDQLMKERVKKAADEGPAELREAQRALEDFHEMYDDAHEARENLRDDIDADIADPTQDMWTRLEEFGVKPGSLNEWAEGKLKEFLKEHNEKVANDLIIEARRKRAGETPLTPYHQKMVEIHGEEWRYATPEARTEMINTRAMAQELGGEKFEAVAERREVDPDWPDPLRMHPRPEGMVAGDIAQSAKDLVAIMDSSTKADTPGGRAARVTFLSERADRLRDALETMPDRIWGSMKETAARWREAMGEPPMRDPSMKKLEAEIAQAHDEMRFVEDELRQHYENANPKAKNAEYGLKQVLNNAADLSDRANLPRGAYVRRVSDFLKPGARDIRDIGKGLKYFGFNNKLRNHVLKIAEKTVGDVDVVALTGEQMHLAATERDLPGDTPAFYDRKTHRIFISQETLRSPDRAKIIGHEITHPMTIRAMEMFPKSMAKMEAIRQELRRAYFQPSHPAYGHVQRALQADTQALNDVHEFIAQLWNDGGDVARALNAIETPHEISRITRPSTMRLLLADTLKTIKEGLLNMMFETSHKRLLDDATLSSLDLFERLGEQPYERPSRRGKAQPYTPPPAHAVVPEHAEGAISYAKEKLKDAAFRMERMGLGGALLKARTFHEMGRLAEGGMQHVVRAVEDVWSKIESTAKSLYKASGAEEIARTIADEMQMAPGHFKTWSDYIADEAQMRVTGSDPLHSGRNEWVTKDSPYHKQFRDNYVEIKRKWDALTPTQKDAHRRMLDYYDQTHRKILSTNIDRLIRMKEMVTGDHDGAREALLKHILDEPLTAAEKDLLHDKVPGYTSEVDITDKSVERGKFLNDIRAIRANPAFRKVDGAWHPGVRRGDWVVAGRYNLGHIAERFGGRKIGEHGDVWEFDDDASAQKFYEAVVGERAYRGLHHEGTSKVVYKTAPDGSILKGADGEPVYETVYSERTSQKGEAGVPGYEKTTKGAMRRISAKEAEGAEGTVTRHRVEFNTLLLEFFENQRHAFERDADLRKNDPHLDMNLPQPKRDPYGTYLDPQKANAAFDAMITSLHRSKAWERMDATTRSMTERDLKEAAISHIMSASARSTMLPKRYALGANKDVLRNFNEYARRSSTTMAELQHRTDLSTAVEGMDKYVRDNDRMGSPNDPQGKYGVLRSQLQKEVHQRLFTRQNDIVAPFWSKALARVLQISYLDKLMSPGFVVLNASEPWVLGLPLMAGHHGYANSFGNIGKAYGALGFHGLWGKGVADAIRAAREGTGARFEDNHTLLRERIAGEKDGAKLQQLFDYLAERGYLDRDAGMELATRTDPSTSYTGKALDYLDNISRQVNAQIENVNRGVTGIASYRMAIEKGMSHEAAMIHAADMIHDVSGNYGHWNNPAIFNNPHLKFALQFKRYAQRITSMYVRMFAQSFSRLPSEQRTIARKQLGIMLGSQILLSGGLGLPTEPIKLAILATSPLTGFGPDEAEVWARQAAADLTGNAQFAEGIMRGFPRAYLDIGIGTRLGHDSLWSHGTIGKKPADWFSTLGHYIAGAPGGMFADWATASGKAVDAVGNFARGYHTEAAADASDFFQTAFPIKLASDTIGAAQQFFGGHTTRTPAGQPLGYQPTVGQAVLEASGIRSGTAQEASDKRFALTQAKARYAAGKNEALQRYSRASTPAEKRAIQEDTLRNFNPHWPQQMQLTRGDFIKAQRRYDLRQTADPDDVGVVISKRQAGLRDRFSFYNN